MNKHQGSGKTKALIGILVVALVAVGLFFLLPLLKRSDSLMVTELYKYYPEKTQLFIEFEPGTQLQSRFLHAIDSLAMKNKQNYIAKADKVEALFEPELSFGIWVAPQEGAEKANSSESTPDPNVDGHVLAVLTVKPDFTYEKMAQVMDLKPNEYTIEKSGEISYFKSNRPNEEGIFAKDGNYLLFSSEKKTIELALAEADTPKSVIDNPDFKKNLDYLPKGRQGTIFVHNLELQKLSEQAKRQAQNAQQNVERIAEMQKQIQKATPVMVAGIMVKEDEMITVDMFTPVEISNVDDDAMRQDILALLKNESNFNLPKILPENTVAYGGMMGLGQYYDLFVKYVADDQDKQKIQQAENQFKMIGLDLRKNIVALFDGQSGFGLLANAGNPEFLLFLNNSDDTMKTLDQMGMLAAQMTRGTVNEKLVDDAHKVKVLESQALPVKIAYSSVEDTTLVLGTQNGVDNMYEVKQDKAPSLSDDKLFKQVSATWPDEVNNVFYINMHKGAELMDTLAQKAPGGRPANQPSFKEVFQGIEAMGGANSIEENDHLIRGYFSVKLAAEKTQGAH